MPTQEPTYKRVRRDGIGSPVFSTTSALLFSEGTIFFSQQISISSSISQISAKQTGP